MADANDPFGLGALTQTFDNQDQLLQKRQAEEAAQQARVNEAQADMAKISVASAKVSQSVADSMGALGTVLDQTHKNAQEQDQLLHSGNPWDALQLVGKQMLNPEDYTRAGRDKKLAEASQEANVRVSIGAAQQAMLQDASKAVEMQATAQAGPLNIAKMAETQGQERIQAELTRVQAQAGQLATSTQMQNLTLANMGADQTRAALASSKGQPINVGGVTITPGALETRVQELDQRQDIQESREAARTQQKMNLDKRLAQRELSTMNLEELRPLMATGDPSGRFDLDDIKHAYDIKSQAQTDIIGNAMKQLQFADFGANVIAPAADQINQMQPGIPKGTPLEREFNNYKLTVGTVAQSMNQFKDPQTGQYKIPLELSAASNLAVNDANSRLEKAISTQAKFAARGDKNMEMIYDATYRGQPIPKDVIESAVTDRLSNNKPLDDILPASTAAKVKTIYQQTYQNLLAQAVMNPVSNTAESRKILQQQAQQTALEQGVGGEINDRTIDLLQNQTSMPDNPLTGVYDPAALTKEVALADQQGRNTFKSTYNLTDEEMGRIAAGQTVPDKGVGQEQIAQLSAVQNQAFFMRLDGHQLGLAKKYVDWWTNSGRDYISKIADARHAKAQGGSGVQDLAFEAYAGQMESQQSNEYIGSLRDAYDNGYDRTRDQAFHNMISFDQKPEYRQAALLNMNRDLSPGEKKQFMTGFLLPLVTDAQGKGLNYEQTNTLIERAIGGAKLPDPSMQKILQKVQKTRDSDSTALDSILTKPFFRSSMTSYIFPGVGTPAQVQLRNSVNNPDPDSGYGWFQDIFKGQSGSPTNTTATGAASPAAAATGGKTWFDRLMQGDIGGFRDNATQFDQSLGSPTEGQPAR